MFRCVKGFVFSLLVASPAFSMSVAEVKQLLVPNGFSEESRAVVGVVVSTNNQCEVIETIEANWKSTYEVEVIPIIRRDESKTFCTMMKGRKFGYIDLGQLEPGVYQVTSDNLRYDLNIDPLRDGFHPTDIVVTSIEVSNEGGSVRVKGKLPHLYIGCVYIASKEVETNASGDVATIRLQPRFTEKCQDVADDFVEEVSMPGHLKEQYMLVIDQNSELPHQILPTLVW